MSESKYYVGQRLVRKTTPGMVYVVREVRKNGDRIIADNGNDILSFRRQTIDEDFTPEVISETTGQWMTVDQLQVGDVVIGSSYGPPGPSLVCETWRRIESIKCVNGSYIWKASAITYGTSIETHTCGDAVKNRKYLINRGAPMDESDRIYEKWYRAGMLDGLKYNKARDVAILMENQLKAATVDTAPKSPAPSPAPAGTGWAWVSPLELQVGDEIYARWTGLGSVRPALEALENPHFLAETNINYDKINSWSGTYKFITPSGTSYTVKYSSYDNNSTRFYVAVPFAVPKVTESNSIKASPASSSVGNNKWYTSTTTVLAKDKPGSRWNDKCGRCGKGVYMGFNAVEHDGECK